MTVHVVNLTNPLRMEGPLGELPIAERRVRVRIPERETVARVHLLVADRTPRVERSAGYVDVTVPAIADHEVVAIDFG